MRIENVYLPGDEERWGVEISHRDSDHIYACQIGKCWHDKGDKGCFAPVYAAIREAADMIDGIET